MISSVWPLELLVLTTSWIYLSVQIHSLCNGPCIDYDGALGHYAHHVRYDKLYNALKFDGASAVGYVLIVIWPHSEL